MGQEPKGKALVTASVASMIDQFNRDNVRMLQEMGYEVTIACNFKEGNTSSMERQGEFRKEMKEAGVRMVHVPIPRSVTKVADFLRSVLIMRRDMAAKGYQLVHCQSPIGGVVARLAAAPFRKKGMKVIYYAHGFHFYTGAPLTNWIIYYQIEKFCSLFTDCQITLNREDYGRAKRKLKAKSVVYMPGVGIDLEEYDAPLWDKPAKRKELSLPADKAIVLSIGELSVRKNVVTTLEAFAKLNPPDAVLVFCGLGPLKEELEATVARHGVGDKVFFLGYRTDLPDICKISDLLLFPSKQEGLASALMQAMAAGLPILCSDIRGNHDLIKDGEGGYLYDPFDVDGYADGMRRLLSDEGLAARMGAHNRKAIRRYGVDRVNARMKRLYMRVAKIRPDDALGGR